MQPVSDHWMTGQCSQSLLPHLPVICLISQVERLNGRAQDLSFLPPSNKHWVIANASEKYYQPCYSENSERSLAHTSYLRVCLWACVSDPTYNMSARQIIMLPVTTKPVTSKLRIQASGYMNLTCLLVAVKLYLPDLKMHLLMVSGQVTIQHFYIMMMC